MGSTKYPEPLIVQPTSTHKQTIIILHGRGSNAHDFYPPLLATTLQNGKTLQTLFPNTRFIFPTASKSRATSFNRSIITQWFDNYSPLSVENQCKREDVQYNGLRETTRFLHMLLRDEIELVGANNVVLGGLSQGAAASLMALLLWQGEQGLGGVFGMCAWLPLRRYMEEVLCPAEPDEDDIFRRAGPEEQKVEEPAIAGAIRALREEVEVEATSASAIAPISIEFLRTPVFLGHGTADEKVPIKLGREAMGCMQALGVDVEWKEYSGLGHWYSSKMLGDLVTFLKERCGMELDGQQGKKAR
ncbi:MAG: hypothetical protein Q9163_003164 [Psora crenata]